MSNLIAHPKKNYLNGAQTVLNHWTTFNNTSTAPTVTSDASSGMTIEKYVYYQGDSDVAVVHYKYIGGGHDCFTASYQGSRYRYADMEFCVSIQYKWS